jgi:hypothetical protein
VRVSLECLEDRTMPAVDPLWALMLYPTLSPAAAANLLSPAANATVDQAALQSASQTGQTPGTGSITGTTSGSTTPSTGGSQQGQTGGASANTNTPSPPRNNLPPTRNDNTAPGSQNPSTSTSTSTNQNSNQSTNQSTNQLTADANAAAANDTPGGDSTTLQSVTSSDSKDFDPDLGAVLSRILSSPLLGSGILAAFAAGRIDSFRQTAVVVVDDSATLSAVPPPANGPGSGAPGAAGTAIANESASGLPSRASFTPDPTLAVSPFASSTGALRFQGIDFRPVNSSGVGVVGTVLAGVDAPNAEGHPGAAGVQQAVAPGAAADNHTPPAYDAALKKFLLGVDSPAPADPGAADARIRQVPVPAGVGQAPVRVEGAAFDDVFAGGPEAEDGDGDDDTEGRGGLVVLLAAPLVYLHWFPVGRQRRKKLPGPDLGAEGPEDRTRRHADRADGRG